MPANLDHLNCLGCGYALRGLPDNVCPECGCAFDPDALVSESQNAFPRRVVTCAATALIVGAGSVPAAIVIGLDAVRFHGCSSCCRPPPGIVGEAAFAAVMAIVLAGPSIAVLGTFLDRLRPAILTRLSTIGFLAAATTWITLLVILSTAR